MTEIKIRCRRLPHLEGHGAVYFVTFRLADSLPKIVLQQLQSERQHALAEPKPSNFRRNIWRRLEDYLDGGAGACYLAKREVALVVTEAIRHFDCAWYRLFAWCVMPNHVHAVVEPLPGYDLPGILHSWKSFSAKEANRILRRSGAFWQREYYDHLIRDGEEFTRAVGYVAENPQKGGLRNWPWVWVRRK